jgi:hypothetical protein
MWIEGEVGMEGLCGCFFKIFTTFQLNQVEMWKKSGPHYYIIRLLY